MTRDRDGEVPGRLHRRDVDRGASLRSESAPLPVPGKATLTQRLPFATPGAAARNAVSTAVGAARRVAGWAPLLMTSIEAADYLESGRLSFEIRWALRRAETGLTDLEHGDPENAIQLAAEIGVARAQLAAHRRELALLLRAAPVIEDAAAGSADAEIAWRNARAAAAPRAAPVDRGAAWASEASSIAAALGLGPFVIESGVAARVATESEDARGVAVRATVHLHPDRVKPGTAEGREVLAHELVHLAQARLPADQDAGRDAAEDEAAEIARTLASGGSVRRPQYHIDLSRPAADRHAVTKQRGESAPPTELRAMFLHQLAATRGWTATLRTLVARTPSERVDVSRKQALEVHAAVEALGAEMKILRSSQTALEAHESARMIFDMSHLAPVATVKAEREQLGALAAAWIRAHYAADAFAGVRLWLQLRDEVRARCNDTLRPEEAGPGEAGPYALFAKVKDGRLMGYSAYHRERHQHEWLIGADDVDVFAASVGIYVGAARAALPGSDHVEGSQADGARGGHVPSNLELGVARTEYDTAGAGLATSAVDAALEAHGGPSVVAMANLQIRMDLYAKEARRIAETLLADVDAGRVDAAVARDAAIDGRNEAMRNTRKHLSPAGRATSEAIKSNDGRSAAYLVERKTKQLVRAASKTRWNGRKAQQVRARLHADSPEWEKYVAIEESGAASASTYAAATEELGQRPVVSKAIIQSAGRTNAMITKVLRYPATAGAVIGVGNMIGHIRDAKEGERLHTAARELSGFAGGIVAAEVATSRAVWLASLVVRTNVVILAVSLITSIVGSAIGAKLGTALADSVGGAADLAGRALLPMGANITGGGFTGMMERNQRSLTQGGVTAALEDLLFEYDNQARALEVDISRAPERPEMERLQLARLDLVQQRSVYDELYRAAMSGELDERELLAILEENDL